MDANQLTSTCLRHCAMQENNTCKKYMRESRDFHVSVNIMADKDRKAEIERRKKRLEELRQAREAKKKDVKTKEVSITLEN